MLASTVNPRPKYLLMVRALAGDSTITRAWPSPADFVLDDLRFAISHDTDVSLRGLVKMSGSTT
jgi:hypothetical protein